MYKDSTCFDPTTVQEALAEDGFSQTHVPNCTPCFDPTRVASNVFYDPLLPLNLPPQPPTFRELLQSLPHGINFTDSRIGSLFNGMVDEREASGGVYQYGDGRHFDSGVLQFSRDMKGRDGKELPNTVTERQRGENLNDFVTERQRRENLNDKYKALRNLVPNPTKGRTTKNDRASIVEDAIEYIKELLRTVNELKILVEKKRCARERIKRHKTEDETADVESTNTMPLGAQDQSNNGSSLRSSWLQRKLKNTEVVVRIIDDEVTIKLVQQKRINCLLFVSKALDDLQLDLYHVAGGLTGNNYRFLFNARILEGSSVYASAIANKLIKVVDRQYAAIPPTSSY
ncbi:unnamed protein product [Ilex paraguariensis]|uniref:BHLH domain-containing protein n=1 Tax=Ilex paraguariensis TaxID=185542 RepID=A0ABC8RJC0_9AQUA